MSYAVSKALQVAIYQRLQGDAGVTSLIGAAIFDEVPAGVLPETYVSLGAETVLDRSDKSGSGAEHRLTISILSEAAGFADAKAVAVAISDALEGADLTLTRGRLVYLKFDRATARREGTANTRRIDLRFRARVEDNI
ncbi:DUF3168 domain-containing protein [Shimia gijangensis]|uniref:DUF3168 domain-containing protein n=1 Tax=Shimia gijangensis TaxID=1470563 RepID=UPI000935087C|nr:DUF3168 domain-containing protein [Shimia gijangensis]